MTIRDALRWAERWIVLSLLAASVTSWLVRDIGPSVFHGARAGVHALWRIGRGELDTKRRASLPLRHEAKRISGVPHARQVRPIEPRILRTS